MFKQLISVLEAGGVAAIGARPVQKYARHPARHLAPAKHKKSPSLPWQERGACLPAMEGLSRRVRRSRKPAFFIMSCRVMSCGIVGYPATNKTTVRRPLCKAGPQS